MQRRSRNAMACGASATMPDDSARVAEQVDARDLKSRIRKGVRVRFPSRAPRRRAPGLPVPSLPFPVQVFRPEHQPICVVQRRLTQAGATSNAPSATTPSWRILWRRKEEGTAALQRSGLRAMILRGRLEARPGVEPGCSDLQSGA